jgi:hypothetical protein
LYAIHTPLPYLVCACVAVFAGLLTWQCLCRNKETLVRADVQKAR